MDEKQDQSINEQSTGDAIKGGLKSTGKTYPDTVRVKAGLVVVIGVIGLLLAATIMFNMYQSTHHQYHKDLKVDVEQHMSARAGERPDWDQHMIVKNNPVQLASNTNTTGNVNSSQPQATASISQNSVTLTPDEMKKILGASISTNQITESVTSSNSPTAGAMASPPQSSSAGGEQSSRDDQNMQGEKKAFVKFNNNADDDYLHERVNNPISPFELKAGTIIPGTLITGINSDLPGQITAQVRSNVYDTISGKHLLIPQGAKLTGLYDSQIAYGQERVLIVWKRIIFPNGQSINLEGMPGVDLSGYAGFNDQVNNHYFKIFGSVILMSAISAGAQLSQPRNNNNNPFASQTVNQQLAATLGTNIMAATNALLEKNINIQPTLIIRPGYLMNISVTKDIVFPGDYAEGTTYDD